MRVVGISEFGGPDCLQLIDLRLHSLHAVVRRGQGRTKLGILPPQFRQFLAVLAHRGVILYFRKRVGSFALGFFKFRLVGDALRLSLG